jgi:D-methionine transport system substrate-binding protein
VQDLVAERLNLTSYIIGIANDPLRLQLFQKAGLITLQSGTGDDAMVEDITADPKRLKFLQLEAAQLPRALDDVAVAQVNLSYFVMSSGNPDMVLLSDGADGLPPRA